jgi:hypothetical protein
MPAYLALSGGLITGILAPPSGGGTFISESGVAGGQIMPFDSASLRPSGSLALPFALPLSAGAHCCSDDEGGGFGGV